jgi:transcriptional regulator with XRE-family HTH domain
LAEYLRARRELVQPEEVGLNAGTRRRVHGLRREELATLAGISTNYLIRLEQGHDRQPSSQVLDALARALRLDDDATEFLHSLARPKLARSGPRQTERAPASIQRMIDSWPTTPALVHNRHMDVLAANAINVAINPDFHPGANLLRAIFQHPETRGRYGDWDEVARSAVARIRLMVGPDVDDPWFAGIVSELSARSEDFRRLWNRHDVEITAGSPQIYRHPAVGPIELQPERLVIMGTDSQMLIIGHAEPGSPSERALQILSRTSASSRNSRVGRAARSPDPG